MHVVLHPEAVLLGMERRGSFNAGMELTLCMSVILFQYFYLVVSEVN